MGIPVTLRPLRPDDVPDLATLWVHAWRRTMPGIDFAARRDLIVDCLRERAADRLTIVAVDAVDQPLGFATLDRVRGHLHQLAVASATMGQGVATALLDACKAAAPSELTLDVNQANARAVRFYEREGFRRESAGVNAGSGLATWRMIWRLCAP